MTYPFRTKTPKRTCTVSKSDYKYYKKELATDFYHHCGYTNCIDTWFGGQRTFQIDHFKPVNKYSNLKNEYSNLVYCCSYVNRAKSDDDSPNYIDPCESDYNKHFERDDTGAMIGKTPQGLYMVKNLHLNLQRFSIIWTLERLTNLINRLKAIRNSRQEEVKDALIELEDMYFEYSQYLFKNQ